MGTERLFAEAPGVDLAALFDVSYMVTRRHCMAKNEVFIERRKTGDFAVRKPGSERASAVLPTQEAAVNRARVMHPNAAIFVERVRDTKVGGRDKWRRP